MGHGRVVRVRQCKRPDVDVDDDGDDNDDDGVYC